MNVQIVRFKGSIMRSLFVFITIGMHAACIAQRETSPDQWTVVANYPGGEIDDGAAFHIDGLLYMGTGIDAGYTLRNDWWSYNPNSDTWQQVASLPGDGRQYCAAFSTASFGYLFGGVLKGDSFVNDCFRYDPQHDEWSVMPAPPWSPRAAMSQLRIGHQVHMFGGRSDSIHFNDIWSFNLLNEEWTYTGKLPFDHGRDELVAFRTIRGYAVGAGRSVDSSFVDLWEWDERLQHWNRLPTPPFKGSTYTSVGSTMKGSVVVGGTGPDGLVRSAMYVSAKSLQWDLLPDLDVPLRGSSLVTVHDTVYLFGGLTIGYRRTAEVRRLVLGEVDGDVSHHSLRIYPNPAREQVSIQAPHGVDDGVLSCVDGRGQLVWEQVVDRYTPIQTLRTSSWRPGLYVIEWKSSTFTARGKLVVGP